MMIGHNHESSSIKCPIIMDICFLAFCVLLLRLAFASCFLVEKQFLDSHYSVELQRQTPIELMSHHVIGVLLVANRSIGF